ncbi:DUF2982 domain-containing protein [Catenovulum sp. SM1970]|uniref:DUF2982 domain-containing protein n=1 Tax=Marinifaba aquimaris TaxID=2741323 RepID=UPI001572AD1D|nr:DUF2982 domain-containing protein [Marinifaba aquimaris]NTS77689.1 DUF2982 domain-containing protein [Marinifaba aquimaris]
MSKFKPIYISPKSREGGKELTIISATLLVFVLLILALDIIDFNLVVMFLTSVISVAFLIGILKINEPKVSYQIDQHGIIYHHQRGMLKIPWSSIQRVDIPKISGRELAYVGIKLKDISSTVELSHLRVLSKMVVEQRSILIQSIATDGRYINEAENMVLNPEPFKTEELVYKGVQAMYAHHISALDKLLGLHILLSNSTLDREPSAFVSLLRQQQLLASQVIESE